MSTLKFLKNLVSIFLKRSLAFHLYPFVTGIHSPYRESHSLLLLGLTYPALDANSSLKLFPFSSIEMLVPPPLNPPRFVFTSLLALVLCLILPSQGSFAWLFEDNSALSYSVLGTL